MDAHAPPVRLTVLGVLDPWCMLGEWTLTHRPSGLTAAQRFVEATEEHRGASPSAESKPARPLSADRQREVDAHNAAELARLVHARHATEPDPSTVTHDPGLAWADDLLKGDAATLESIPAAPPPTPEPTMWELLRSRFRWWWVGAAGLAWMVLMTVIWLLLFPPVPAR